MFKISPCTFLGGDFCSEASKGKVVSPGVKQVLKEEQGPPEIPVGQPARRTNTDKCCTTKTRPN